MHVHCQLKSRVLNESIVCVSRTRFNRREIEPQHARSTDQHYFVFVSVAMNVYELGALNTSKVFFLFHTLGGAVQQYDYILSIEENGKERKPFSSFHSFFSFFMFIHFWVTCLIESFNKISKLFS